VHAKKRKSSLRKTKRQIKNRKDPRDADEILGKGLVGRSGGKRATKGEMFFGCPCSGQPEATNEGREEQVKTRKSVKVKEPGLLNLVSYIRCLNGWRG